MMNGHGCPLGLKHNLGNQSTDGPVNAHLKSGPRRKHNQRTNGPVNAHLISWPSKAQNIQNLENIW